MLSWIQNLRSMEFNMDLHTFSHHSVSGLYIWSVHPDLYPHCHWFCTWIPHHWICTWIPHISRSAPVFPHISQPAHGSPISVDLHMDPPYHWICTWIPHHWICTWIPHISRSAHGSPISVDLHLDPPYHWICTWIHHITGSEHGSPLPVCLLL